LYSWAKRLRQIYTDQDNYTRVLSFGAQRLSDAHSWAASVGTFFKLRTHLGIVSPDLLASCTTDSTGRDVVLSGFFSSTRIFSASPSQCRTLEACGSGARTPLELLTSPTGRFLQMSSGEAKRTLIARALVHQPETLLFDEPSNALDIAAQFQLRKTMGELARSGLAILLVTHHVSEIIPEIDRVILLRDGRILADGQNLKCLLNAPFAISLVSIFASILRTARSTSTRLVLEIRVFFTAKIPQDTLTRNELQSKQRTTEVYAFLNLYAQFMLKAGVL